MTGMTTPETRTERRSSGGKNNQKGTDEDLQDEKKTGLSYSLDFCSASFK